MAYSKKTWVDDEVITKDALNNMESGIDTANKGIPSNASKTKADFSNGTTKLSNLQITYINKTDHNIVIPYLEPHGILNGLDLTQYSDKGDFSGMSLEDYKKIDFSNDGLAPKTEIFYGLC